MKKCLFRSIAVAGRHARLAAGGPAFERPGRPRGEWHAQGARCPGAHGGELARTTR